MECMAKRKWLKLVICPFALIDKTLTYLRETGHTGCECAVLWLGYRDGDSVLIKEVYRPLQTAEVDMFYIPPEGMDALHAKLRQHRYIVAAQVHSHPGQAFHSKADDMWSIIRYEGALSLVIPNFAIETTVETFLDDAKVYRFSADAQWIEVLKPELEKSCLQIT